MNYEKESFTVPMQKPGMDKEAEKTFADNWERTFGSKKKEDSSCSPNTKTTTP